METLCSICILPYSSQNLPVELKNCKHIFHEKCITNWNEECSKNSKQSICPDCRQIFCPSDLIIQKGLLSQIMKNFEPSSLQLKLLNGTKVQIQIHPSKTIKDLLGTIKIYEKNLELENIEIQIKLKVYKYQDGDLLIHDLSLEKDQLVEVQYKSPFINVFLKEINGTTQCLQLTPSMLIQDLGKIIHDKLLIPLTQQSYTIQGKLVNPIQHANKQLSDYNITNNCSIQMLGRLHGGIYLR